MTSAWIIVMLFIAFIIARLFRSTKLWWTLLSTIVAGLLVGMLSKEVSSSSNSKDTSFIQLNEVNIKEATSLSYTQLIANVTEAIGYSRVVGYNEDKDVELIGASFSNHTTKGRDSPGIEDDS